ncbi:MAG: radical SAM protein [Patescibacteria group bacterium]
MNKALKKIFLAAGYATNRSFVPPESLSLLLTFRCNLRCRTCSIWQQENSDELTVADWLKIVKDLAATLPPRTFVELNGGEPLTRPELALALIKELKKHFFLVTLNSNGLLLGAELVKELEDAGLDAIKISFYSLEQEAHNFLRGTGTSYEAARRAIGLLEKSRIKLEVGILIAKQNIDGLPELIEHLNSLTNTAVILQPLDESVESLAAKDRKHIFLLNDLWPSAAEVKKFFSWLYAHRPKIKNSPANIKAIENYYLNPPSVLAFRCFAGQRSVVVYPAGAVALCFKGATIGNLKNNSLKNILNSHPAKAERKQIVSCRKYCRIIGCNFSRGIREVVKNRLV